ncbi:MAG TPA: discoidin domain-containing protein [Verrucomicrobiae bacterium]|nr:discoidin domain-containing protein [Verrucomicrobiae bacterium]
MKKCLFVNLLAVAALGLSGRIDAAENPQAAATTPVPYLSPEEEARHFVLPEGYRLELVVSDPIIKEPVAIVFDGNGRMFVAEMRSYMQDIDGKDEHAPTGVVSLHWSSKKDGVYDKHTVFVDHLVLPRMILSAGNNLLVNETDSSDIWSYRDNDGDGVADRKKLLYHGGPRGGNLEHQQSGLMWGLDNWLYLAMTSYRLRLDGTNVIKESTPPNGGQWGVSQDDYGKPWFVNAGGELGPVNFQQPIIYGNFSIKDQLEPGFLEVWPLVGIADVQGGIPRFRPSDKTLNHVTAACGGEIYRGDRLPADLRGDLLFCEPVGRLIRRAKIDVVDGVTHLRNAYDHSEFIRSTDPNFRPVNLATGPDGALYIVDMYRGIIQEGNWVKEGSYLRKVVQHYELDKNFGRGRIWRLVHKDFKPGPLPNMCHERADRLLLYLEHPNGWWRDTAQKLIVLRGDKSVVPDLLRMTRSSTNHLARIHALWTLEGLGALDPAIVREKLADPHPQVRIAAIRASESIFKKGDASLEPDIRALVRDPDPNVIIQVMLTVNLLKCPDADKVIRNAIAASRAWGVQEIGAQLLQPRASFGREFTLAEKKQLDRGQTIYKELCFTCHGIDGKGAPIPGGPAGATIGPPLAGSRTITGFRDGVIDVVLKGINGPINGRNFGAQMVSMESNDDAWIAAVLSYIRNSFGNSCPLIDSNDVARVRAAIKTRKEPWTIEELRAAMPQPLTNRAQWHVTASHRPESAPLAIDASFRTAYDSGKSQTPGMWFQIELPQPTLVAEVVLDADGAAHEYPHSYEVELSDDGKNWGKPVAVGQGTCPVTEISFAPALARFIRITLTDSAPGFHWSIHELQIFTRPPQTPTMATLVNVTSRSKFE